MEIHTSTIMKRMIALKSIHPSFILTNIKYNIQCTRLLNTRSSILCLCKSNESDFQAPQPGDTRKQDLLAQIAMLEAQKVRLADYLDEKSEYLTQFGEEVNAEFNKIGEDALKGLDEAGARITANIENQMLEFEESAELNRQEIQERENNLEEFEVQMEDGRNEGLFFKNLFFIGLLTFIIVDSIASSSTDGRKVAVFGAILVALISQFIYEQNLSSETGTKRKTNNEEENN